MISLIDQTSELVNLASDPSSAVSVLLLKARILAKRVHDGAFENWLTREITGYKENLPDYRMLGGQAVSVDRHGFVERLHTHMVSVAVARKISTACVGDSIAAIERTLHEDSDEPFTTFHHSEENERLILKGMSRLATPAVRVSHSQLQGILESVRGMVLDWADTLQQEQSSHKPSEPERIHANRKSSRFEYLTILYRWVIDNKHWLFSGIGVYVLSSVVGLVVLIGGYMILSRPTQNTANQESASQNRDVGRPQNREVGEIWKSYAQNALDAYGKTNYAEAESFFRLALAEAEKTNTGDKTSTDRMIVSLNGLGKVLLDEEKYVEAEGINRKAVEVMQHARPEDDPEFSLVINNLGLNLSYLGQYEEAEALLRRALSLREKYRGSKHPDVAVSLLDLGLVSFKQGNFRQADALYRSATAILENIPHDVRSTDENEMLAEAWEDLALSYAAEARYGEAEGLFKKAIALLESTRGNAHPTMVRYLANYAEMLRKTNRANKAADLEARIQSIQSTNK